jgi:tetratricopeptide (TPR) repeat protein
MRRLTAISTVAVVLTLAGCAGVARKVVEEDRIERLKRDIGKVRFAISTTKTLIARARGAGYLPDLHMRLAELYIEQAKYHYHIAYEKQKGKSSGIVSVQTRLLKNQAIAIYKRINALWPDFKEGDKVLFFQAHELRELGEYDEMIKVYLELADKHTKSPYRLEGLLTVGDYYFDKAQLDQAEKYYQQVIDSPETRVHAMARYKMAWCKINRADFKGALKLFEGSVAAARRFLAVAGGKSGSSKLDLRREALVDSVFPYTEVLKPIGALGYYKERADSKTTFLAALEKLGNRYYVKQNWKASAMIYREILSLTGDTEEAVEHAHRLYDALTQGKIYDHGAQDTSLLVEVIRRRFYNRNLSDKDRGKILETFEKYARDLATRLHDLANEKKDDEMYVEATRAYSAYLSFFGKNKNASLVLSNLAEALYAAKQFLAAGRYYEKAAALQKGKDRQESVYTAVVSYFDALTGKEKITRLDMVQARAGLRRAGRIYVREYPKDEKIVQVKFNIARTFYDAGEFDEAIRLFTALVQQFPSAKEAPVSAHLVLDAYRNNEDFEGLIAAGKTFVGTSSLGDTEFRNEVAQIIKGAEGRLLDSETLKAAGESDEGPGADRLVEIAEKHRGTELGEKALINAFVTARAAGDPDKIFEVGEKMMRAYPNSDKLADVLTTMGKTAMDSLQFSRGAGYLEAAARRRNDKETPDLLKAAGTIRARLGERSKAEQILATFMRSAGTSTDKAELAVRVAKLHVQAGDWNAVVNLLQNAVTSGAASNDMLYLLGYALYRKGQLADAQGYLQQAAQAGKGGGAAEEKEASAAAQFYLGEISFKTFETIQLSSDLSQLGPTLQQKIAYMTQTRQAYRAVVAMGSPVWSVASLGRLSSVDDAAAGALRGLALPDGLPEAVAKQVKGALESNAAPLAAEAKEALKQCAATARKLKVLSEAARACLDGKAPTGDPQTSIKVPEANRQKPSGAAQLERLLAKKPRDLPSILKLGELYLQGANPYMAQLILAKGSEVSETTQVLNLLGVATARLGDLQDALDLFDRATKKDGSFAPPHFNKAALLQRFGYSADAKAELKRVKGESPSEGDPRLIPGAASAGGSR